jgi:hypothetical protein
VTRTIRCTAAALVIRARPGGDDTGRRMLHGHTAAAWGESWDQSWVYVEAAAGEGWVSAAHIESVPPAPLAPRWPMVPHGLAQIRATFGEPASPAATRGRVTLPAPLPLSYAPAQSVTSFACHELVAGVLESAFREVHRRGLWAGLENFGGCFNDRSARGLTKKSTHAWGIAVDVAVHRNALGARPTLDPRIVAIFEDHGFLWGGRWSRPDGMHFQYSTGY